ncbi:hypothetical protein RFI_10296 [Reticulomyxa filosa]|uniref:Uncharacterized protein n=1 Tax=Reticulomyxa filosa TaxID=46433 RepID=X6NLQ6_RETFI|nr:hypothetical protein RFI_10296 [Reticulomyxa filosa]|eukprot:ETO26838.1 hypothetical protein RFI_10296 [Reticulomyxa filosa]
MLKQWTLEKCTACNLWFREVPNLHISYLVVENSKTIQVTATTSFSGVDYSYSNVQFINNQQLTFFESHEDYMYSTIGATNVTLETLEIIGNQDLDLKILGASVKMMNSSIFNNTLKATDSEDASNIAFDSVAMINCRVEYNTYIISKNYLSSFGSHNRVLHAMLQAKFDFCMYGSWISNNSLQDLRPVGTSVKSEQWNLLNADNINCNRVWKVYIDTNQYTTKFEDYSVVNMVVFNRGWNSLLGIKLASTSLRYWMFQDNVLRNLHSNPKEMAGYGSALMQILKLDYLTEANYTSYVFMGDIMIDWSNKDVASQTNVLSYPENCEGKLMCTDEKCDGYPDKVSGSDYYIAWISVACSYDTSMTNTTLFNTSYVNISWNSIQNGDITPLVIRSDKSLYNDEQQHMCVVIGPPTQLKILNVTLYNTDSMLVDAKECNLPKDTLFPGANPHVICTMLDLFENCVDVSFWNITISGLTVSTIGDFFKTIDARILF